eukprot:m.362772 g.362772  ORF g.362772 m.362772 type:complete len:199 (-) comp20872_c0_seq1:77-673(-)
MSFLQALVPLLSSGLTAFAAYKFFASPTLFSWHPVLMIGAFAGLTTYAVQQFKQPGKTFQERKANHSWFMYMSAVASFAGGVIMYIVKEQNQKLHATTIHGFLGYSLLAAFGLMIAFGYLMFDLQLVKPTKTWRTLHRLSGITVLVLMGVELYLGFLTNAWLRSVSGTSWYMATAVLTSVITLPLVPIFMRMFGLDQA